MTLEPCSMTSQFRTTGIPLPHAHLVYSMPKAWLLSEDNLRLMKSNWLAKFGCVGRGVGGLEQQVLELDKERSKEADATDEYESSLSINSGTGFSGRWLIIADSSWACLWQIILYIFNSYFGGTCTHTEAER